MQLRLLSGESLWSVRLSSQGRLLVLVAPGLLVFYLANISLTNKMLVNRTRVIRTCVSWPHLAQAAAEKNCVEQQLGA